MTTTVLHDILRRLQANVAAGMPDQSDRPMKVPALTYRDPEQWKREIDEIFLKMPLLVALSCDVPEPGDYQSLEIAGRPILVVRGDDGRVRTFLNVCRHRGARVAGEPCGNARRFTCPYHAWSYDRGGVLVGVPGRETFGDVDATGLVELPTAERVGVVFAVLLPDADLDVDAWLGGMTESLAALRLDEMHPYRRITHLDSPNWKLAADGYLDGYHLGYLHRNTIGVKSITNRNTYDFFGPHVRIGFANKAITELGGDEGRERPLPDYMSLVHYIFPNVSISGGHGDTIQLSRLLPGADGGPLDHRAAPVLPPARRGRHGRARRGEAQALRERGARRGLRHDLRHQRRPRRHRRRSRRVRPQRAGQPAPAPLRRRADGVSLTQWPAPAVPRSDRPAQWPAPARRPASGTRT